STGGELEINERKPGLSGKRRTPRQSNGARIRLVRYGNARQSARSRLLCANIRKTTGAAYRLPGRSGLSARFHHHDEFVALAKKLGNSAYGKYLLKVAEEYAAV